MLKTKNAFYRKNDNSMELWSPLKMMILSPESQFIELRQTQMAKISKLRLFTTEVAPPRFISVTKRPLIKMLETIDEEKAYASAVSSLSSSNVLDRERYHRQVSPFE
ncbi:hypothetical protein Salat_1996500 [Sesamum alatum]|uniref:Uncharacterized protein n=1 Tax=Sesamum alatum TaxID=300844 RepID=A0AAE1XYH4_9LAMI|nr:hypothetical protein Salat_1996500 [Sesamum alatum]